MISTMLLPIPCPHPMRAFYYHLALARQLMYYPSAERPHLATPRSLELGMAPVQALPPSRPLSHFLRDPHTTPLRCKSLSPLNLEHMLSIRRISHPPRLLQCSPPSRPHKYRRRRFASNALCATRIWPTSTLRVLECGRGRATFTTRSCVDGRWRRKYRVYRPPQTTRHDPGQGVGSLRRRTYGSG